MGKRDAFNFKIDNHVKYNALSEVNPIQVGSYTIDYVFKSLVSSERFINIFDDFSSVRTTLSLIDSNFQYDLFKFASEGTNYILKIAVYSSDNCLENEFNTLKQLSVKCYGLAPLPILYDRIHDSSDTCIMITTYENSDSFTDLSTGDLAYNLGTIANTLSFIHEKTEVSQSQETTDLLNRFSEISDYESNLDSDTYNEYMNIHLYTECSDFVTRLKSDISSSIGSLNENKTCICHTDLSRSRILYREGNVKFINWQDSFVLDMYFDVAFTLFNLGIYDTDLGEIFIEKYHSSHENLGGISLDDFKTKLTSYTDVVYKLVLVKIISNHFYENIVYGNERTTKYVRLDRIYECLRKLVARDYPNDLSRCDKLFINF